MLAKSLITLLKFLFFSIPLKVKLDKNETSCMRQKLLNSFQQYHNIKRYFVFSYNDMRHLYKEIKKPHTLTKIHFQ